MQSSIEAYLSGSPAENFQHRNIHPIILWIFLSLITVFMVFSRVALKRFLNKQRAFRSIPTNPQIKNTVTFKTLTYELFFLGILSTFFILSFENNETYILLVLNLINLISNSFLLTYLLHNQEAVEYVKSKSFLQKISKSLRSKKVEPIPSTTQNRVFVVRTPTMSRQKVRFKNDCELVEISC